MKYYDPVIVEARIKYLLSEEWKPHPNFPTQTRVDAFMDMFNSVTETVYSAGRLEVQCGVVDALDLRHLLGLR